MDASLDTLVNNLGHGEINIVKRMATNGEQIKMLLHKGVFSYEYSNSWERLRNTFLPTTEDVKKNNYQHPEGVATN